MKKTDFKASFQNRSFRAGGFSMILTVLVLVIVVLLNMVMDKLPTDITQLDVTANQRYSLSQQTKSVVKSLKEPVTVYWIVNQGNEDPTLEKILKDYDKLSAKLRVEKIDPYKNPGFISEYEEKGCTVNTINSLIVESEKRFRYVDNVEDIYVENEHDELTFAAEGALTSAIDYCTSEKLPKLYILGGHDEKELPQSYITQLKMENIDTIRVDIAQLDAVPEEADCVLLCAPAEDIREREADMLEAYLQGGGKMLLMTDYYYGLLYENSISFASYANLEKLMAAYGVSVVPGMVLEGNKDYYLWDEVFSLAPDLSQHPAAKPLIESKLKVQMIGAHGLKISDDLPENVKVETILSTSSNAYSKVFPTDTLLKAEGDPVGPFPLGVAITDSSTGATIVWYSAASLADATANVQVNGGNMDLLLNSLNWLCDPEESNLTIRDKGLDGGTLVISSLRVAVLSVLLVGLIPAAYLACGVLFWLRRRGK